MAEYGVTKDGFVRKRLDVIKNDIYAKLKEGWGYDVTINPQSFLNVLVTGFSDEIAKLWEVAEGNYYSMYTMSAEGANLDNAMQFGGITREKDARTTYMLACTAPDDTIVSYGVLVKSATNPAKMFRCSNNQLISRNNWRRVEIKPYLASGIMQFYVTINGDSFQYMQQEEDTEETILEALRNLIIVKNITASVDSDKGCLVLEDNYKQTSNTLAISNNLLLESVTSNILFESMEYGPVVIANGLIKELVTMNTGIKEIWNDIAPVLGRFEADDIEARQNYVQRVAIRSRNMIESITAEIYNSVDHVESVTGYENDTEMVDDEGRPPKSVEIIVDGGDDGEIADIIYRKKANGIRAYGNITMDVADVFGNIHKVGFSRPDYVYVWLKVTITGQKGRVMVPNYVKLTQEAILGDVGSIHVGESVYLQTLIGNIYRNVLNVAMVDIQAYTSDNEARIPVESEFVAGNIIVNHRQKAVFDHSRIEVILRE